MSQAARFAVFSLLLLASGRIASSRSTGAPTDACTTVTQDHAGIAVTDCSDDCPFSVSLTEIDGTAVAAGTQTYKCGSLHTLRIQSSDSTTFRGFAIQARQSTETFSNDASFLGQFDSDSADASSQWRIWECATDSATHTSNSDKTSVDVVWKAPANFGPNVTMWFSITRTFSTFHAQLKGLELGPDASCPPSGTASFSCDFAVDGSDVVASNCQAVGFIPSSIECQVDDQPAVTCTTPYRFLSSNFSEAGTHTLRVIAGTFFPETIPVTARTSSSQITINPRLSCSSNSDQDTGIITVSCTANGVPDAVFCLIDGEPFAPCELDNIQIDTSAYEVGSHILEISFSSGGLNSSATQLTFTSTEPPFQASCSQSTSSDRTALVFQCEANKDIASTECALNGEPIVPCTLPLNVPISDLKFGENNISLTLSDASGTSRTTSFTLTNTPAFQGSCSQIPSGDDSVFTINCTANRAIASQECSLNGEEYENCTLPLDIAVSDLKVGENTLQITLFDEFGGSFTSTSTFTTAPQTPFQASCSQLATDDPSVVSVNCTANREIASQTCTLNDDEIVNCMFPLNIPLADLKSGENKIELVLLDGEGGTVTSTITITLGPAELSLSCNATTGDGTILVKCNAEGGVVSNVTCNYDDGDIIEACDLTTSIDVSRFEAGSHTLQITAVTADGLMAQSQILFTVSVPALKIFCNVYGIPGRVDIQCSTSRELSGPGICQVSIGGNTLSMECDIENFVVTDDVVPPGDYSVTIIANDTLGQSATIVVPFTLTAGVSTPGFRVLTGNVLLSQNPAFLNFAALSGSTVSVEAADEPRTAIVQSDVSLTINCSQWFSDNPGDSTSIKRQLIDEFGEEINEPYVLEPTSVGRIISDDVSATITRTVIVQGAEDFDNSIFTCESCMSTDDGLIDNCKSASVRVYPIGSVPEIDAAADDDEPTVEGLVTVTKVGADFCVSFSNPPVALQILCDEFGAYPIPTLSWYKDDILAVTMDSSGGQTLNEDFFSVGNNELLRFGVLDPPPLAVFGSALGGSGGQLFLNFIISNVSRPDLLPSGVEEDNINRELFDVLLGGWECRLNNSLGEDSAVTELSDCAVVMFVLDCQPLLAGTSGPLRINCFGSRTIESVECNYDDGAVVESCDFPIVVDYTRFAPGEHSLLITAISDAGENATSELTFTIPEPLEIDCNVNASPGITNVVCVSSKDLFLPPTCSLRMQGAETSVDFVCDLAGISLTSNAYTPGDYVLTITAFDVEEQTATEVINITISDVGDSPILCSTAVDCSGDGTIMSARECCVGTSDGLSYSVFGSEVCQPCIVFGWFNSSFTGSEQAASYRLQAGYLKGAQQAAVDLEFSVSTQPISADEGSGADYSVVSTTARISYQSSSPASIAFILRTDSVALEQDESFTLELVPSTTLPSGSNVFFQNVSTVTIIDSDTVNIFFSEDDYRSSESSESISISLIKTVRIASPVTVSISPRTINEAIASGQPLPLAPLPVDNPFSPSSANLQDFNNSVITVTFDADENDVVNEKQVSVPIIDDDINEADEQIFVVQMEIVSSLNADAIESFRTASLCRIIDDDSIRIGFEMATYTFQEPETLSQEYSVYLTKEDGRVSEQTFVVFVETTDVAPISLTPATFGADYRLDDFSNVMNTTILFPPSEQRVTFSFIILSDDLREEDEGFLASSAPATSEGGVDAPSYLVPTNSDAFIIIASDIVPIDPVLTCVPLFGSRFISIGCFLVEGEVDSSTCSFDGAYPEECELNLIEIDQYSFSPGPHTLLISFNLTTGEEGSFQHNFTGVVRQPVVIDLLLPSVEGAVLNISEGESQRVIITTTGFAYSDIPVTVSTLTYSEYADLGFELADNFEQFPDAAATADDDFVSFSTLFSVSAGAPLPPGIFEITANLDNLNEDSEGFIVYLEFNESALDERDMGQVGLARDAYLVRILDQGPEIAPLELFCTDSGVSGRVQVMCTSNNPLQFPQLCTPLPLEVLVFCNASSFILSVTDYVPGTYNITIDATDMYGQTTTEVIPVFLSEPMLIGMCNTDSLDGFSISCTTSLDETQVPLTYTCSYNDGPEEDCDADFIIDQGRFEPGIHSVQVTITTGFDQELQAEPLSFIVLPPPELDCLEQFATNEITLNCFLINSFDPIDFATCSFDGGLASRCDPTNLRINRFAYSPEPHILVIAYNTTGGANGQHSYNFTGQIRQPAVITITSEDGIIDVVESFFLFGQLSLSNFSFAPVPIRLSTLTFSEYEALGFNLEDDFDLNDIPVNAADEYDYQPYVMRHNLTSELVQFFFIEPYADGVPEDLEGFVLFVELLESELDPRDVGYVSLPRSAHLVRINDTGISNFEILIGEVDFEDIDELLSVAAEEGEFVRAYVTDDRQTAIVSTGANIRLDWYRWVNEVLGDSAVNATFTVRSTQLDESGNPIGSSQVLEPSEPGSRIRVNVNSSKDVYYVSINSVVAVDGAEDPDRAIYELEACLPQPDGTRKCYSSNMTVFAVAMVDELLQLDCSLSGIGGRATVMCDSNNPLVFPQMCAVQRDLDELIGYCNASSYTLSVFDFPPGDYNVTITATDINGQTVTEVVSLFLSEPFLSGVCLLNEADNGPSISCDTSLDDTLVLLEYSCSYNSGPEESCSSNFVIDNNRFDPGLHTVDITISTFFGQSLTLTVAFVIEALPQLECVPLLGARLITLSCFSPDGMIDVATCSFDSEQGSQCDLGAYEIDQYSFSPGTHSLTIAFNLTSGSQGEFSYDFIGEIRESVVIRLDIDDSIVNVQEGESVFRTVITSGFSYGAIPLHVTVLNYSTFASGGYNLDDFFDPASTPSISGDDYDFLIADRMPVFEIYAGGPFPSELILAFAPNDDGVMEEVEGLVAYFEVRDSELDERDRGEVTLERSAYLLRITPSLSSRFQILIGDVELGQRPELLEVASTPGSRVFAFVTDDMQTAVVTESSSIRLDWIRWVREALGGPSNTTNYTVYRTLLDESGNMIGNREPLPQTPFGSRIIVRADATTNEFYVDIASVIVVQGAEDADTAIYELEACNPPQPDGSVWCGISSLTVYGIGQPPLLVLAGDDDEPEVTPSSLRSPVGADFCLTFDSSPTVLQLSCDLTVEDASTYPLPERVWYKDGVQLYRANIGDTAVISEDFYQSGNNSILQVGVVGPTPLLALSDGSLIIDWTAQNLTATGGLPPEGELRESFRRRVFMALLGNWECRLENSLGSSYAESVLINCATAPVNFQCTSDIGDAIARIECDADFELVTIECAVDDGVPQPCTLPYEVNRLEFSSDEHRLTITVVDSRGMGASYELEFNGNTVEELPTLFIDFKVLGDPQAPGDSSSQVIYLNEVPSSSSSISIEIIGGESTRPIPFRVLPLTYDEYEARYPNLNLNSIFPSRPIDPAGDSDFNTTALTFSGATVFYPSAVISDSIPKLSEGFIYYLEVDRANTDPTDVGRIQYFNRHILAVIQDDDTLVDCKANVLDDVISVSCPGIDGLPEEDNYQCSVDFAPPESCLFPFEIARSSVLPGRHNVRLYQRIAGEPIPEQILGGAQFQTEPLFVHFVNDTPTLGVDTVYAEIEINRPGVPIECHLTHLDNSRKDCSNGVYELDGIPPGDFTLRVVAVDPDIDDTFNPYRRAIARNRLWVHGDDVFCVVHVRNDGVTVNGNSMTIDFYSTGQPSGFLCSYDRQDFVECTSPYTVDRIPIGRHRIKVVPEGCDRDFRGYTTQFNVL